MDKKILNEINRVREIMGLMVILEQDDIEVDKTDTKSDEEKYGHVASSEPGEFRTYLDGDPYKLFVAKTNILSKAYFQSGEYTELESKSLYYPYRRPNPYAPGGYLVDKVQEQLDDEIQDALNYKVNSLIQDAKSYGWFKEQVLGKGKYCQLKRNDPKYCLGEAHLEEFGDDVMKVYREKPPMPDTASSKERKRYQAYKDGTFKRYYIDKKEYRKYLDEKYKDTYTDHEGVGIKQRELLKKYEGELQKSLEKKYFDENYQYSKEKFKRRTGGEENPEYSPEGAKDDKSIAKAKREIGDVNFSPADRINVMDDIQSFVDEVYEGSYEAAMSDKVWKKKGTRLWGSGWVKRGVKSISLSPQNIETKIIEPDVVEIDEVGTKLIFDASEVDGQLFKNNLWEATDFFTTQLDEMVQMVLTNQANVSDRFDGADVKMTIATEICEGGGDEVVNCEVKKPYPYIISSSCSQVPNCVDDEGVRVKACGEGKEGEWEGKMGTSDKPRITFEQLSKNRANTAKKLIAEKLGAIGVEMTEPTINWQGDNPDVPGTSGPAWKSGDPLDSEAYQAARYVKIQIAIRYEANIDIPEPPQPETYKVGDFNVVIVPDYKEWDPWWPKWPPIKWPKWKRFKNSNRKIKRGDTIKCPQF